MRTALVVLVLLSSLATPPLVQRMLFNTNQNVDAPYVTFTSVADTYVGWSDRGRNFGAEPRMLVDHGHMSRSLLRFDTRGFKQPIHKVELRVYVNRANGGRLRALPIRSDWDERTVTMATAPRLGDLPIGTSSAIRTSGWVSIELTGKMNIPGMFEVALRTYSAAGFEIASREAGENAPQLRLHVDDGGDNQDPTPTPSPTPPVPGTPTPTPTPSPAPTGPNAVTPGSMNLTSTFNSIGVEQFFSGDDNNNAVANLEFKATTESAWRSALPLWPTRNGGGFAFYGSALLLDPGTEYDVRITFSDPDGVDGASVVTGRITTRAETIAEATQLAPTHFVSPGGNDANAGTSASAAWRTIEKAFASAPVGAVVRVAPGTYAPPTTTRRTPITLVAQNPAVDDAQNPINAGSRSVIEPATFSSPGGASQGVSVPWQRVTLKGPATGQRFTVWKWAGSPVDGANLMTFAASREEQPMRVAHWDRLSGGANGYTMSTPEGWAEVLYENDTYTYGYAAFGRDIYVRMPDDIDPNTMYVWVHRTRGHEGTMVINAPDSRISGFEIRMVSTHFRADAHYGVYDHNLVYTADVSYEAEKGSPSQYPTNHVVEHNRMADSNLWSDTQRSSTIPWLFVKHDLRLNGKATNWRRVGGATEGSAINGRGGANLLVVRHNTIEGYFNGVSAYSPGFDRYAKSGYDIHNNVIRNVADDALEPDIGAINWRVWDNRIENLPIAVSVAPLNYGPLYLLRNEIWRLSNRGVGADSRGEKVVGPNGFKYSGESTPTGRIYVIHNTFWTDVPDASGGSQGGGGSSSSESFYVRNNIFRQTKHAFVAPSIGTRWDEDYNYFFTSDPKRGIEVNSKTYLNVRDYRAATKDGAHSNTSGDFHTDVALENPRSGDLDLADGSPLIDAGTPVPNISDRPGVDYQGSAPDLGANEK